MLSKRADYFVLCVSGVMSDWLGFGSESHTPEQLQQQTESLVSCIFHYCYLSHGPQITTPAANALMSKTPSVRLIFQVRLRSSCLVHVP